MAGAPSETNRCLAQIVYQLTLKTMDKAQAYRAKIRAEIDEDTKLAKAHSDLIDTHYPAFYEVAEKSGSVGFKIETPFGNFQFYPEHDFFND